MRPTNLKARKCRICWLLVDTLQADEWNIGGSQHFCLIHSGFELVLSARSSAEDIWGQSFQGGSGCQAAQLPRMF